MGFHSVPPFSISMSMILLFAGSSLVTVLAYPTTVPPTPSVCRSMTPGHGPRPLSSKPNCVVTSVGDSVKSGGQVEVIITAVDGSKPLKGYYLQARDNTNSPIGTFSATDKVKVHSCGGIRANAAHHGTKELKKSISVFWKAPAKYDGTVTFTATCVQDFENFWTMVKAQPLKVST